MQRRTLSTVLAVVSLFAVPARAGPWPRLPTDAEIQTAGGQRAAEVPGAQGATASKVHRPSVPDPVASSEVYLVYTSEKTSGPISVNGQVVDPTVRVTRLHHLEWLRWDEESARFTFSPKPYRDGMSALDLVSQLANRPTPDGAAHERTLAALYAPPPEGSGYVRGFPVRDSGRRLCDEAWRHFGAQRLSAGGFGNEEAAAATAIQRDFDELRGGFMGALERYRKERGKAATRSDNVAGAAPAATWLFTEGGLFESASRHFVFNRGHNELVPESSPHFKPRLPGTEPALKEAMIAFSRKEGRKLTPADVFYLALLERDGDARDALLLAHNTLRSLARAGDFGHTGVSQNLPFFDTHLESIRKGDNAGPWYHLFGTAYFEMEARGEWGPFMAMGIGDRLGEVTWDNALGPMLEKVSGIRAVTSAEDPNAASLSDIANWTEQMYREHYGKRVPDPEKYCFNVWGAKLGSMLYSSLGYAEVPDTPPSGWAPDPYGTLPLGLTPAGDREALQRGLTTHVLSPVRITWEMGGRQMRFDALTGQLTGYVPVLLTPMLEPDGTWAVSFTDAGREPYTVHFEGLRAGTLHVVKLDRTTGLTATIVTPVQVGERLSTRIDPRHATAPLVRGDGTALEPVVSSLRAPRRAPGLDTTGIPGIEDIEEATKPGARPALDTTGIPGIEDIGEEPDVVAPSDEPDTEDLTLGVILGVIGVLVVAGLLARRKR